MQRFTTILLLVLGVASSACSPEKPKPAATAEKPQTFEVKGVVKKLESNGKTIVIQHEAVPNYMPAMTMPFDVKDTNELHGLAAGDSVSFRMLVTRDDGWIDQIRKFKSAATNSEPDAGTNRAAAYPEPKEVDPLNVGDFVPNYHFTNELGQAVQLRDYLGKAIGITFIFTSCPFPTFCPKMSNNFYEIQEKLKASGVSNWRLLSITIDPAKDNPDVLLGYGKRFKYDPTHWSFLTSDPGTIGSVGDNFGMMFWNQDNTISHNLRTVVIDAKGRVRKIVKENFWTPAELSEEILQAAKE
jgi:protein SCO1/2